MIIYNYLFYKSCQLAKKIDFWEDAPHQFGVLVVMFCFGLNMGAVFLFLDWGQQVVTFIGGVGRIIYISSLIGFVWGYYHYKRRHQKIVDKWEMSRSKLKNVNPILVILFYLAASTLFGHLASLYSTGDWIFSK